MRGGGAVAARRLLLVLLTFPCVVLPARGAPAGDPAIVVDPTNASRSELARVVGAALRGVPVTLANDALTSSSILSLQHTHTRDPAGQLRNGRELSRPETFELFRRGSRCLLMHTKDQRVWTLRRTRCEPVGKPKPG